MSKVELCPGDPRYRWVDPKDEPRRFKLWWQRESRAWSWGNITGEVPPTGKRPRLKCPRCGRKIVASAAVNEDADLYYIIPPHKPKHWWKRRRVTDV